MKHIFPGKTLWRDQCVDESDLLNGLFSEHRKWVQEVAEQYDEVPLGFTEWALTGHIAIAADKLDCYTVQDYQSKHEDCRPDLYIATPAGGPTYVFEVKHILSGLELHYGARIITSQLLPRLKSARDKLYKYRGEADYRCSLVAAPIWVKAGDWKSKYSDKSSYGRGVACLRMELRAMLNTLPQSMADYCAGFVCTYDEAIAQYGRGYSPFVLGVVYVGRLKQPGKRGR